MPASSSLPQPSGIFTVFGPLFHESLQRRLGHLTKHSLAQTVCCKSFKFCNLSHSLSNLPIAQHIWSSPMSEHQLSNKLLPGHFHALYTVMDALLTNCPQNLNFNIPYSLYWVAFHNLLVNFAHVACKEEPHSCDAFHSPCPNFHLIRICSWEAAAQWLSDNLW